MKPGLLWALVLCAGTVFAQTRPRLAILPDLAKRLAAGTVAEDFVLVEGGTFQMGSNNGRDDERPIHSVTVKSFYLGKYEVTQQEWREVMGTTIRQQRDLADESGPLRGEGDNYPMYYVSWYDAVEYCNRRSLKEGLRPAYSVVVGKTILCDWNANGYRLPTEAEWEYAAKGGNKDSMVYEYSGSDNVDSVAWYEKNSGGAAHPVGTKAANSLGIHDMSGNVYEWCWDWHSFYGAGAQTDPRGASSESGRVSRGGSWGYPARFMRSTRRGSTGPSYPFFDLGFRLVRPRF